MDQLHHHGELVFIVEGLVQRGNIDMIQRGQRLHFAVKPLHHFRRAGLVRQQDLHGFAPLRDQVLHLVYGAETAGAELANDLVIAELLPRFEWHMGCGRLPLHGRPNIGYSRIIDCAVNPRLRNCEGGSGATRRGKLEQPAPTHVIRW